MSELTSKELTQRLRDWYERGWIRDCTLAESEAQLLWAAIGQLEGTAEFNQQFVRPVHEPLSDQQAAERAASIAISAAGKHAERVVELEAEVSTLRESLAEVNRLLSLNVREVERLRSAQPPGALLESSWRRYGRHLHDCQRYGEHQCTCGFVETCIALTKGCDAP